METAQSGIRVLKTSQYKKNKSVFLEWFWWKKVLNKPIQDKVLRPMPEEMALKLNTEFTWLKGWIDKMINKIGRPTVKMKMKQEPGKWKYVTLWLDTTQKLY